MSPAIIFWLLALPIVAFVWLGVAWLVLLMWRELRGKS